MQGRILPVPLTAVQIISILRKTGRLYNSEIAAVWDCSGTADTSRSRSIPRRRLTNIVKTCPDKLAAYIVQRQCIPHGIMSSFTPANFRSIIRSQMIFAVCIGCIVLRYINTAAVYCGGCLRSDNRTIRAVHGTQLTAGCIVKSNNTAIIFYHAVHGSQRAAGGALVASDGSRTGGIFFLCPINQILRNRRKTAVCACPLLDLISQRPENHGRIVAVTFYRGFQRKFCPGHGTVTA